MYVNEQTKEILSREDLKALLNCSIPQNEERIGDWLLVHGEPPAEEEGREAVAEGIQIENGTAIIRYRNVKPPRDFESAKSASDAQISALMDRIRMLEGAVIDLAQTASNAEDNAKMLYRQIVESANNGEDA